MCQAVSARNLRAVQLLTGFSKKATACQLPWFAVESCLSPNFCDSQWNGEHVFCSLHGTIFTHWLEQNSIKYSWNLTLCVFIAQTLHREHTCPQWKIPIDLAMSQSLAFNPADLPLHENHLYSSWWPTAKQCSRWMFSVLDRLFRWEGVEESPHPQPKCLTSIASLETEKHREQQNNSHTSYLSHNSM